MSAFANRGEAGRMLGERLRSMELSWPVVLGIPRGGIPIAVAAAEELPGAEAGVIVARKLGAPGQDELAIGAVASDGSYYLDSRLAHEVGASEQHINDVLEREREEAARRESQFDGSRISSLSGRTVVIVDDGVATGATAIAAIRSAKAAGAGHVVFAVPVGPPDTIKALRKEADTVIALREPSMFWAVGQFYQEFESVGDSDAVRMLEAFRRSARPTVD